MVRWGGWEMVVVAVMKGHVQRVWGPAGLCGGWGGSERTGVQNGTGVRPGPDEPG